MFAGETITQHDLETDINAELMTDQTSKDIMTELIKGSGQILQQMEKKRDQLLTTRRFLAAKRFQIQIDQVAFLFEFDIAQMQNLLLTILQLRQRNSYLRSISEPSEQSKSAYTISLDLDDAVKHLKQRDFDKAQQLITILTTKLDQIEAEKSSS